MGGKSTLWVSLGYRQVDHDTFKVAGDMCDDCNFCRALKDWCRTCPDRHVCEGLKRIEVWGCWKQLPHPYKSLSTALYGSFSKFGDLQMDPKIFIIILIIRTPHSGTRNFGNPNKNYCQDPCLVQMLFLMLVAYLAAD